MKHLATTYRPIFRYGLSRIGGLLVLLVLLFGTTRQALASQLVLQLYNDNNEEIRYNWVLDSKDSLHLSDEDFYSHSGKVLFRINKYGLPKNDKTLRSWRTSCCRASIRTVWSSWPSSFAVPPRPKVLTG